MHSGLDFPAFSSGTKGELNLRALVWKMNTLKGKFSPLFSVAHKLQEKKGGMMALLSSLEVAHALRGLSRSNTGTSTCF